jgi:hypothetical protein
MKESNYNLKGKTFNRLTVVSDTYYKFYCKRNRPFVKVICECNPTKEFEVYVCQLLRGYSLSCGCFNREKLIIQNTKYPNGFGSASRVYGIWKNMKRRCSNKNYKYYDYYGGRGISVCQEWTDYNTFLNWSLNNGYKNNLTLERINVNGNYCPENCEWITKSKQTRNTRRTRKFDGFGETKHLVDWQHDPRAKASPAQIRYRLLFMNWNVEDSVLTPAFGKSKKRNIQ